MARVTSTLIATVTPALHALVAVAQEIADREGEERASQWAHDVIAADPDLFCAVEVERRPELRPIIGGRS